MSVNIGLMIWKEMKRQDLSSTSLAKALDISKLRLQKILKESTIDTEMLLKICETMNFNFFALYADSAAFKKLNGESQQAKDEEINRLKSLVVEKNTAIELKEQLIKTQLNIISLLEKGQYR